MSDTIKKWIKVFDMPDGNQVLYVNAGQDIKGSLYGTMIVEYSIQITVKFSKRMMTKVKGFPTPEAADHYFNVANQLAATSLYREAQDRINNPLKRPNAQ